MRRSGWLPDLERGYDGIVVGAHARHDALRLQGQSPVQDVVEATPPGRYVLEPPPDGFATWDDWRRETGLPDSYLGMGPDSIVDPSGGGPRIWFREDEAAKVVKNRLHIDIHVSGGRTVVEGRSVPIATRAQRVDAEARRLAGLGANS